MNEVKADVLSVDQKIALLITELLDLKLCQNDDASMF